MQREPQQYVRQAVSVSGMRAAAFVFLHLCHMSGRAELLLSPTEEGREERITILHITIIYVRVQQYYTLDYYNITREILTILRGKSDLSE